MHHLRILPIKTVRWRSSTWNRSSQNYVIQHEDSGGKSKELLRQSNNIVVGSGSMRSMRQKAYRLLKMLTRYGTCMSSTPESMFKIVPSCSGASCTTTRMLAGKARKQKSSIKRFSSAPKCCILSTSGVTSLETQVSACQAIAIRMAQAEMNCTPLPNLSGGQRSQTSMSRCRRKITGTQSAFPCLLSL